MHDLECFYCTKNQDLQNLMIEIAKLKVSTLYLNKDQTHKGRCIIALDKHVTELFYLNKIELLYFMDDVSRAAEIIQTTFKPNKINYAIYGDLVSHLHFHLVPKYEGSLEWGEAFNHSPSDKQILGDAEYRAMVSDLQTNLLQTKTVV
ncbi:HIT family protein [Metabacillus sp. Hm71]|uniref:HIT family protein n=1 Tax=Metabacillus sp. Hm71 TaxID=3450743 RepID=UPI003F43CEDD